ncbi:MAG: hypothetical protein ACRDGT_03490 [Candidatus Limnocylindria bacterium]
MSTEASPRATGYAWLALRGTAGLLAVIAIIQWIDALTTGRPVLYGEGAVASAALLFRDGDPYGDVPGRFVAANYPPLYLWLASLGDPFHTGRAVTIASALAVSVLVWWRASGLDRVPRAALTLLWPALVPVAIWGAAVKPDMLAVALTFGGVAVLERSVRAGSPAWSGASGPLLGGALLALAVWAKPTALLPALAVLGLVAVSARPVFWRSAVGAAAVAALALGHAALLGAGDVWRHVVVWNALPWSAEQALLLAVLGAATLGILLAAASLAGAFRGIALAYLLGAGGVALLGGREGATVNYLLDLGAATVFGVSGVAARLGASAGFPLAGAAQLLLGFAVLAPFGIVPGRDGGTGAWGPAERMEVVRSLERDEPHLVEDSGLLVANGITPVIDDVFLWSRLLSRGEIGPDLGAGLAGSGIYATVVSEFDLERYDEATAAQRARWHPLLVREVLARYELDPSVAETVSRGGRPVLWVYRPR